MRSNGVESRVDHIMSALQATCIEAQDLAKQKLQDWFNGIDNSVEEVKVLGTWVKNPLSLRGREATDFIHNVVHPRDLDLSFLTKVNLRTASPYVALVQRNVILEQKNQKLEKELLEQKLLFLEYKSSTEAKLEEARIREENMIKSSEDFKTEMKLQQEAMQKKQEETNALLKQIIENMNKPTNP